MSNGNSHYLVSLLFEMLSRMEVLLKKERLGPKFKKKKKKNTSNLFIQDKKKKMLVGKL